MNKLKAFKQSLIPNKDLISDSGYLKYQQYFGEHIKYYYIVFRSKIRQSQRASTLLLGSK